MAKKLKRGLGSVYKKTVPDPITGERKELANWYIQFFHDGITYRESTGTSSRSKALACLRERRADVVGGFTFNCEKIRVGELLTDLLDYYAEHNPKSLKCFANGVIDRLQKHFGAMRANRVQTRQIKDFVAACKAEGLAPATINRHLALLRRAYSLGTLHDPRKVSNDAVPRFGHHMQRENNVRQGFFEHSQYVAMRDALTGSERAALVFAYYSGCRLSEILNLKWEQVDFACHVVRLRAGETKNHEGRVLSMGAVDSELYQMLATQRDAAPEDTPWVFYRKSGKGAKAGDRVTTVKHGWEKACAETGVQRLFHDLRRTAVRNMIRAGVPEAVARRISGHKTASVFNRYNVVDEKDLHNAAAAVSAYVGQLAAKCVHCGAGLGSGAKFCGECGQPTRTISPQI